jgi:hypothetical protein
VEKIQAEGNKPRAVRLVVVLALIAFLATCALIAAGRMLKGYSLRDALSPDVPVLELHVAFVDTLAKATGSDKAEAPAGEAKEKSASEGDARASVTTPSTDVCPEVVGGDLGRSEPKRRRSFFEPTPLPCPLKATWRVYRNPVVASLFFVRGIDVIDWYEANPKVTSFRESDLWKGLVRQLAETLKIRAEELQLEDWKGEFLGPLVRDALAANASLHYDLIHGSGGFLFAFDRSRAPLVDKALPIVVRGLATNAYEAKGYEQPLVEIRFYGRTFYLTQVGDRVSVSSSLEGLLNIQDQSPFALPQGEQGSLVAVVRPESFMDKLLVSTVGVSQWPISIAFELSRTVSTLDGARVPRARAFQSLASSTDGGVLASLPHDALAAVALSAHVPLEQPVSEWSISAPTTGGTAGLGLVWDVSGKDKRFDVGLAVAAPAGANVQVRPQDFVSSRGVVTTCAGGAVWLAASSDPLLVRMRESCERQSLSIRDLSGLKAGDLEAQQVSLVFNTGVMLHELFVLGGGDTSEAVSDGASTTEGEAPEDPEKDARERIAKMIAEVVPSLPVLGLMGRLNDPHSDLRLKGFMSTHGGV